MPRPLEGEQFCTERDTLLEQARVAHDQLLAQVKVHSLNDLVLTQDGTKVLSDAFINTNFRSKDGLRFIYVGIRNCKLAEVQTFLQKLRDGTINLYDAQFELPDDAVVSVFNPTGSLFLVDIGRTR